MFWWYHCGSSRPVALIDRARWRPPAAITELCVSIVSRSVVTAIREPTDQGEEGEGQEDDEREL